MTSYRYLVVTTVLALFASCTFAAEYHGFTIDDSKGRLAREQEASLYRQLDIIERAALPSSVIATMKQTSIVVDPDLRGNPGIFAVRGGVAAVYVRPMEFPQNKPILLHEFLHAYHFRVLGLDRPEIEDEYQQVKHASLFPERFQSAHFLENAKEFFAVTGTLYLFGNIQQPPFDCSALSRLRPQYLKFLKDQFGASRCPGLEEATQGAHR